MGSTQELVKSLFSRRSHSDPLILRTLPGRLVRGNNPGLPPSRTNILLRHSDSDPFNACSARHIAPPSNQLHVCAHTTKPPKCQGLAGSHDPSQQATLQLKPPKGSVPPSAAEGRVKCANSASALSRGCNVSSEKACRKLAIVGDLFVEGAHEGLKREPSTAQVDSQDYKYESQILKRRQPAAMVSRLEVIAPKVQPRAPRID